MLYLQADNHDFNDAIFEVLDRCEANCSSAMIDSLENLLTKAKDKTNGWKEIDGKSCFIPNIYIKSYQQSLNFFLLFSHITKF